MSTHAPACAAPIYPWLCCAKAPRTQVMRHEGRSSRPRPRARRARCRLPAQFIHASPPPPSIWSKLGAYAAPCCVRSARLWARPSPERGRAKGAMAAPPSTLSGGVAGKNKNVRARLWRAPRRLRCVGADRRMRYPQARLPPEVNRVLYIRCACAPRCAPAGARRLTSAAGTCRSTSLRRRCMTSSASMAPCGKYGCACPALRRVLLRTRRAPRCVLHAGCRRATARQARNCGRHANPKNCCAALARGAGARLAAETRSCLHAQSAWLTRFVFPQRQHEGYARHSVRCVRGHLRRQGCRRSFVWLQRGQPLSHRAVLRAFAAGEEARPQKGGGGAGGAEEKTCRCKRCATRRAVIAAV